MVLKSFCGYKLSRCSPIIRRERYTHIYIYISLGEKATIAEPDQRVLELFCAAHPPGGKGTIVQYAVNCCRIQACYDHETNGYKLFIRTHNHPAVPLTAAPGELSKENFDNALVKGLVSCDGVTQLMGQAPRGSFKRPAQMLLDELGI